MSEYNGGPAFPNALDSSTTGMSLRDWFAGQAPPCPIMSEFLSTSKTNDPEFWGIPNWSEEHFNRLAIIEARWRFAYAAAMLKAVKR